MERKIVMKLFGTVVVVLVGWANEVHGNCSNYVDPTQNCTAVQGNEAVCVNAQPSSINATGYYSKESCMNQAISQMGIPMEYFYSQCSYQMQMAGYAQDGVGLAPGSDPPLSNVVAVAVIVTLYFLFPLSVFIAVLVIRSQYYAETLMSSERLQSAQSTSTDIDGKSDILPVYLSFHRLKYSVKLNKGGIKEAIAKNGGTRPTTPGWDKKVILKGLTGAFRPGTLSAIMGPSGCGKSTLLDVLADRKSTGYTTGKVLVNGRARTAVYKRVSGYVMQFDALFPHLTVREILMYTAELRIPGQDWNAKRKAVSDVIKALDLRRCADSRVGGGGVPGISGGQARRVTVGVELVTRPMILFLDEPTTGLDAFSSLQLVRTLRVLADTGRTVVATIHQPRPDIFNLFNTLLLMKDGEVAYFGKVMHIRSYFASLNIVIPEDASVADFVVDLTYSKEKTDDTSNAETVSALASSWKSSTEYTEIKQFAKELEMKTLPDLPPPAASAFADCDPNTGQVDVRNIRFSQGIFIQIFILLRRSYKNISRDKTYFVNITLQMLQFLFYGLLFLGLRTQELTDANAGAALGIQDVNYLFIISQRAFLFQVMNTVMLIEVIVIANAFVEKKIFRREHASGAYSVFSYHAQFIIRFYVEAIGKGFLAAVLCYFFPPMNFGADPFFFFAVVLMVCSTMGSSMAFLMVSLVPNAEGAANIHAQLLGTFGLYSGFFLFANVLPIWMQWLYYMLPFKYSFEALEWNEWGGCMTTGEAINLFAVDLTLNRWTNLLVFMFYPPIFHAVAIGASFLHTRPKSFWVKHCSCCFSSENFEEEEADAHESGLEASGKPKPNVEMVSLGTANTDGVHIDLESAPSGADTAVVNNGADSTSDTTGTTTIAQI